MPSPTTTKKRLKKRDIEKLEATSGVAAGDGPLGHSLLICGEGPETGVE